MYDPKNMPYKKLENVKSTRTLVNDSAAIPAQNVLFQKWLKLKKPHKEKSKLAVKQKCTKEFLSHIKRSNKKAKTRGHYEYNQSNNNSVFGNISHTFSMNDSFSQERKNESVSKSLVISVTWIRQIFGL